MLGILRKEGVDVEKMIRTVSLAAIMLLLSFSLVGCAGNSAQESESESPEPSTEAAIAAYSVGDDTAAEDMLSSLGISKEDYPCYQAVGAAQGILEGDADDERLKALEYALRIACGSESSDKKILVDSFDALADAANEACNQNSVYFESIYGNLSDLAEANGLVDALGEKVPGAQAKLDSINAEESAKKEESNAAAEARAANAVTAQNIDQKLAEQEIYCSAPEKRIRSSSYKSLYPDYVYIGSVQNNSGRAVRDVTITVAAWDENGFPVRIHSPYRSTNENLMGCQIPDANIQAGSAWSSADGGWDIAESCTYNIAQLKAIVWQCTFVDGTQWTNPLADEWASIFANKQLQ